MAKQDQVLLIEPQNELKFRGPFVTPVTSFLKLTNPTTNVVCFKIKTTAPKRYCVRPNSGILEPKAVTTIAVSLQPFEFDPNEKNKHKFMVQTLIAPDGKVNLDSLWKEVDPETLMDSKLKCVFEMPVDGDSPNPTAPDTTGSLDETRRMGDSQSVNHEGGELAKAAKEVKLLREEESSLRQENMALKEELLRLHHQMYAGSGGTAKLSSTAPARSEISAPPISIMYIGFALVMVLLGILLGKFLL